MRLYKQREPPTWECFSLVSLNLIKNYCMFQTIPHFSIRQPIAYLVSNTIYWSR